MGQIEQPRDGPVQILERKAKAICTKKMLKKRFPIMTWLPAYSSDDLLGDVVAGLTVGLTVIPQAIAYAIIAGIPPNYGLYSSFVGAIVYTVFGSCKDITIGPTAIMSILSHEYTFGSADLATLLCFLSGVIILVFGLLNLGVLITFVSKPVISGFTSAAAISIASSQVGGLVGIKIKSESFVELWSIFFSSLSQIRWTDTVLGVACIIILLFMRKMKEFERFKRNPDDVGCKKALKMTIFLLSVGRNAIVVVAATILAAALSNDQPFIITGHIEPGLPSFDMPKFNYPNETFSDVLSQIGSGVIILPLISILEAIAIGSAFSQGKTLDATQEMIALGLCNVFGAFFHSMPTTGSFSRTAVNASSGVRTPAGGLTTAALVILALAVLTPYFQYIPKSALAAVIIVAVVFMIEYHDIKPIWKVKKADEFILWLTFLISIFWKLEYGILLGIGCNVLFSLLRTANPKVDIISVLDCESQYEDSTKVPHVIIEPREGLQYCNIDKVRSVVTKTATTVAQGRYPVVVDCKHFTVIDYSAAKGIEAMIRDFAKRQQMIYFVNATPPIEDGIKAICPDVHVIASHLLQEHLLTLCSPNATHNSNNVESRGLKNAVDNAIRRLSTHTESEVANPLLTKDYTSPP